MNNYLFHLSHRRILSRSVMVGTLTLLSLLSGIVPSFSGRSATLVVNSLAYAQSVDNDDVRQYARVVLLMEPIRQTSYTQIKKIVGSVPNVVCHQPNTIQSLPRRARPIAINYCNQSKRIVESNGLTIPRFNAITAIAQSDSDLRTRIQNELIRLQKGN